MPNRPNNQMPPPNPLAMVVCDYIYRDPYTGKYTLIGTFSTVASDRYPIQHPYFFVYLSLTDGRGNVQLRFNLIDVNEERDPVFCREFDITFDDPRMVHEIAFAAGGMTFPAPGEYRMQLFANDEFLVERRLMALLQENPEAGEEQT